MLSSASRLKRVCLYIVGQAPPEVAERVGNYLEWFRRLCEPYGVTLCPVDGRTERADPRDYDGVVVTGSASSLVAGQREAWMVPALELTQQCHGQGTPFLGVCFGHQLIGAAAGAEVVRNPLGWEMSTWSVRINADGQRDPLFRGLSSHEARVNFAHEDIIDAKSLPKDITVLSGNAKTHAQAIAWGEHVRGVQFHPEFSGAIMRRYVETRSQLLQADADARECPEESVPRLQERAMDCADGERIFGNFIRHFVRP